MSSLSSLTLFPCSVNKISSLADFEDCHKLQELYLRKNNIKDINDLVYLQVWKREFIISINLNTSFKKKMRTIHVLWCANGERKLINNSFKQESILYYKLQQSGSQQWQRASQQDPQQSQSAKICQKLIQSLKTMNTLIFQIQNKNGFKKTTHSHVTTLSHASAQVAPQQTQQSAQHDEFVWFNPPSVISEAFRRFSDRGWSVMGPRKKQQYF